MQNRSTLLIVILVCALAARLGFTGLVVGWDKAPIGDEIDYHAIATNVAEGNGFAPTSNYPTARRPPLYPTVLAALYKVTGPNVAAARLLQVMLGTLLVWLVFKVSTKLFDVRVGLVAAVLTAFNPFLVFASGYLLTENLYIDLLLLGVLVLGLGSSRLFTWRQVVLGGVVFGLGTLARPSAFLVELWVIAGVVGIRSGALTGRAVRAVAVVVITLAVLLPWAVRNHSTFGRWVFLTTHGGITFYQGNNENVLEVPQYHGGVSPLHALPGHSELSKMSEIDKDRAAWDLGKRFLSDNKRQIPVLLWRKFQRFWRLRSDQGMSGIRSGWWFDKGSALGRIAATLDVGFLYAVVVIPLFLVGVFMTRRRGFSLAALYGIVLIHTGLALVFYGSLRMRIPVEPVMAMFAAVVIVDVAGRYRRRPDAAPGS